MSIDSFSSNTTTLSASGGEVILTVRGNNLDQGVFQIYHLGSSVKHDLNVSSSLATARIKCVANGMNINRIDTFGLYLNGFETDKKVAITIESEKESDTNDEPNSSDDTKNPDKPDSSDDQKNPDQDKISNEDDSIINSTKQTEQKNQKENQKKSKSIIILVTIALLGAVSCVIIVMRKKMKQ